MSKRPTLKLCRGKKYSWQERHWTLEINGVPTHTIRVRSLSAAMDKARVLLKVRFFLSGENPRLLP